MPRFVTTNSDALLQLATRTTSDRHAYPVFELLIVITAKGVTTVSQATADRSSVRREWWMVTLQKSRGRGQ
ncbi:hypothetical protein J4732_08060 [Serratia marcescens]|uniref:Uncharacterized protein n=1 Tax=Serratia marcescens TaxID=615 RepID=A0A939NSY0_SERMA|nr:hypothetical protein [Serratia marcescens]